MRAELLLNALLRLDPDRINDALSRILVSLVAALVDLADASDVEALGVLLGGRLLPGKLVQISAMMHPAVSALAGLHRGGPGDGYLFRSTGTAELGLTDLEVIESDRESGEVAQMVEGWIYRLITEGAQVLSDGATVGDPGQRVDVRAAPSSFGQGTVYRLSYAAEQGSPSAKSADDTLETVQCPKCAKTVHAPVVRLAFIPRS
jgi:hypothetical protein